MQKKVYEAVLYSDPVSSGVLASAESQIAAKFAELSDAVIAGDKSNGCARWLRTPGNDTGYIAYVTKTGSISYSGSGGYYHCAVRPAMWIDLNS